MGLNTPRPALNAISVDVTANWLSSGKLEYVRTAGGSIRIYVDTLYREGPR